MSWLALTRGGLVRQETVGLMTRHIPMGGLVAIGFDPTGEYVLAVSHSGRGVFSIATWQCVARDYDLAYPELGQATGIGPLADQRIDVVELDSEHPIEIASRDSRILLRCASDDIQVIRASNDGDHIC